AVGRRSLSLALRLALSLAGAGLRGQPMDLILSVEAFVRVAETGSFANAARQMGDAKSVVTTRVKQLEESLGVSLCRRSTRAVKLSVVGRCYFVDCHELMQKLLDFTARSHREGSTLTG